MKKVILVVCIIVCLICGILTAMFIINRNKKVEDKNIVEVKSTYNNPYVPEGFKKIETEKASWEEDKDGNPIGYNNGLVIEDEIGNQFVWIPVEKEEIDEEIKGYYMQEELIATDREKEQIKKYGGFYIARFEAGIASTNITEFSEETNNVEGIPVSKKNAIPWNYIQLKNAKASAIKMYETKEKVESDLPTVLEYVYIMQWLKNSGIDIYNSKAGNFSTTTFDYSGYISTDLKTYIYNENGVKALGDAIIPTGASEYTNLNNIYDLAGNLEEFADTYIEIQEDEDTKLVNHYKGIDYISGGYPSIGGRYNEPSSNILLGAYFLGDKSPLSIFGFRVVLYNK